MVAGTVLRDLIPRRLRIPSDDTPWVTVRDRRRTVRSALVGGRLLTIAGIAVLLATVVMVFLDTADTAAFAVVVGLTLSGAVACVGWVLWYRYRESTGAIQRRQLQLVASRLGAVRPVAGSRERLPVRENRVAHRPRTRADSESEQRSARRVAPSPLDRRPTDVDPGAVRTDRRGVERDNGQPALPRSTERYLARREMQHIDHHPVARRNDRPAPRSPSGDPLRQPAQPGEGTERIRRDNVNRSRGPESRPAAPSPRTRPER